jgi:hypothetical protein
MKKIFILSFLIFSAWSNVNSQTVSARTVQSSYSSVDPDGAGPATGSVTFTVELISTQAFLADGMGFAIAFQTSNLMAPSVPIPVVRRGPLATAVNWTTNVDLPTGNNINGGPLVYGGQPFNRRSVFTFSQSSANPNCNIPTTWTPFMEITYWTLGSSFPQGGYITIEPGTTVPLNSLSTDGGSTEYEYLSPFLNAPTPLGSALPVQFTKFETKCTNTGTLISWATAQEFNSSSFEIERSTNGSNWVNVGSIGAAGNSASEKAYQQVDLNGGNAFYRIKQVDKDGSFVYTAIERANCAVKTITTLIYPVPATDVLNIVIKSDRAIRTQLQVFDIHGKLVKTQDANVQNGNNNFRINLSGLAAGDYIIRSNDATLELNKVFTIAR